MLSNPTAIKRDNNFDIVRLLLAETVVLFHAHHLSAQPALKILPKMFSGGLAVEGFFAISGFLIFSSYERATSLGDYSMKRAARILPGYWLSTVFCLIIAFSYGCFHVGKFLIGNLSFANFYAPGIPGVFQNHAIPAMNGSLWTIKVEVMFYIAVPLIVWLCRKLNRDAVLVALFCASVAYRLLVKEAHAAVQLPGVLSFFLAGALVHYHHAAFMRYGKYLMLVAAVLLGLHEWTHWFFLRPVSIPFLVLGAALLLPVVKGPTRWGDFSYGTYVLHWPVLQLVIATGLFAIHPWLAVLVSLVLVAIGAVISWFAVENPALAYAHRRKKRRDAKRSMAHA